MGKPGPVPKRSDKRRRRNKADVPIDDIEVEGAVVAPAANSKWHPTAKKWFDSLKDSGQAQFYEPSDWMTAYLIAESISRELREQVVGLDKEGAVVKAALPPKGASLQAWLKAMSSLCVTEGDRRRAGIELSRPDPGAEEGDDADVDDLSAYRDRTRGAQ